jgi:hypothetical protein
MTFVPVAYRWTVHLLRPRRLSFVTKTGYVAVLSLRLAIGCLIWPLRDRAPPGVTIEPLFVMAVDAGPTGKPPTAHLQRAIFKLSGVALWTLSPTFPTGRAVHAA